MDENEIGTTIVDRAVYLHKTLGSGLLETIKQGYLLNFGEGLMENGITRTINWYL